MALPPAVRLVGDQFSRFAFLAFVVDPDTGREVRIRYDARKFTTRYRCDQCGADRLPHCIHAAAVQQLTRTPTSERTPRCSP